MIYGSFPFQYYSNLFQNTKLENNQRNKIKQKLSFIKYIVSVERLCLSSRSKFPAYEPRLFKFVGGVPKYKINLKPRLVFYLI